LLAQAAASVRWRVDFVRTFVERDLPALGSQVASATTERFWRMLAHVHGQVWNSARFASSFGVADTTVRCYLELLSSTLVVNQLRPWHENVGKRQVRSRKRTSPTVAYCAPCSTSPTAPPWERHPSLGASWEGFVISRIVAASRARPDQLLSDL